MYHIRINKAPFLPSSGQRMRDGGEAKEVRTVLPEVDRSMANIEAEKGETVFGDFDNDDFQEHYKVGGERHSKGGTPLQVPEGSFVFSDTKRLKLSGPILEEFGKNAKTKKKYTFAELSRQYNMNKFKALLGDRNSDKLDKDTAQVMLDNCDMKLAKLAFIQEGMKGFPQGVPSIAAPFLEQMGMGAGSGGAMGSVMPMDEGRGPGPGMPMDGGMGAGPMGPEGMSPEEMMAAEMMASGMGPEGMGAEGMLPEEMMASGMGPEGMGAEGMSPEEMMAAEMMASGMGVEGMPPEGMMPPGAEGMPPEGMPEEDLPKAQVGWWENPLGRSLYSPPVTRQPKVVRRTNWVSNPGGVSNVPATGTPAVAVDADGVPVYTGNRGALRASQRSMGLNPNFNRFDAPWLTQFGYDNTGKGFAQALQDIGYEGDVKDVGAIQDYLVDRNLAKGNDALFNSFLNRWRTTNKGLERNLPDVNSMDFSKMAPDQKREWLKKMLVDNMMGVRTAEMIQSLLRRTPQGRPLTVKPDYSYPRPNVTASVPLRPADLTPQKEEVPSTPAEPDKGISTGDFNPSGGRPDIGMPWWQQDKLNLLGSFRNRYGLQKYMPSYVGTDVYVPSPTFYDPTRALAANQEAVNAQNMAASMLAGRRGTLGPQQGAANAANILSQTQQQNVGVGNQFAMAAADLLNRNLGSRAIARKTYLDELATTNQQYDNSVAQANMNILNNVNAGITNAQEAYWLNRMNKQFQIDPSTGRLTFTRGRGTEGFGVGSGGTGSGAGQDYFKAYKYYLENADPTDITGAREYAQRVSGWKSGGKDDDDDAKEMLKNYYRKRGAT